MDLKEVMQNQVFAVVGDTLNEEKYAYKIKDLCIHPAKGLALLKACEKSFKCIVIQPGAGDEALLSYLERTHQPFIEACVLVGLKLYP